MAHLNRDLEELFISIQMNQPFNALLLIKGGGFPNDGHRENTSQQGEAPSETMGKCMATTREKYYRNYNIINIRIWN